MSARIAILCPGQGGQHPAMFDFLGAGDRTRLRLQEWSIDEKLGVPLEQVLGDDKLAYSNRIAQPLIVAATLAAWETIRPVMPPVSLVAGYSIGELAAYAVAGSLTPAETLDLAVRRAALMDDCTRVTPGQGLVAVSGIALGRLEHLLAASGLSTAITTGPDSAIAGGLRDDFPAALKAVEAEGGRTVLLPVEIASHTPLMQPAIAPFREALRNSAFRHPDVPVLAGISAEMIREADRGREVLARQLGEPIRWQACMQACVEAGVRIALDLGPGAALSRMFQQQYPQIECRSVQDFRSPDGIAKWVESRLGS